MLRRGIAAALAAFYPELVWYSVHYWSEPVFLALLWWAIEGVMAADARRSLGRAVLAGILWGLAILTRETALYFYGPSYDAMAELVQEYVATEPLCAQSRTVRLT